MCPRRELGSSRGLAHRVPDRCGRDGRGDRTEHGERPTGREPGSGWWLGARRQTEDDVAVHGSEGGIHRASDPGAGDAREDRAPALILSSAASVKTHASVVLFAERMDR